MTTAIGSLFVCFINDHFYHLLLIILMAIWEAIKKVNLTGHETKKMMELSGGMRKRVGIAQLLMRKPSILIF
jgi:ABC-type transport system involved in cytochrome c biogenesis ATPase subunit